MEVRNRRSAGGQGSERERANTVPVFFELSKGRFMARAEPGAKFYVRCRLDRLTAGTYTPYPYY